MVVQYLFPRIRLLHILLHITECGLFSSSTYFSNRFNLQLTPSICEPGVLIGRYYRHNFIRTSGIPASGVRRGSLPWVFQCSIICLKFAYSHNPSGSTTNSPKSCKSSRLYLFFPYFTFIHRSKYGFYNFNLE